MRIIKFIKTWNEIYTIPLAILLFWLSPHILRFIDPTAATYDAGIFQIILFTTIQALFYNGVAWIMLKLTFPKMYKYFDDCFENDVLIKTEPWKRAYYAFLLFALYFIALVVLSRVI